MKTIILTKEQIENVLTMDAVIEAVEEAYKLYSEKKVILPPVLSLEVDKYHGEVDIKSGYDQVDDLIGVKLACGYWNNRKDFGIPNGLATIMLMDAKNGVPVAIMEGGLITDMRTGAAGAVSAKYLAKPEAKKVAMIGTGVIARMELLALSRIFQLEEAFVWNRNEANALAFIEDMKTTVPISYTLCADAQQCVQDAEIIITTTPSKEALIQKEWVKPGTHIACIGADMPGKQEIDAQLFSGARVFVDSIAQCKERGEVQHALAQGLIKEKEILEIGDLLLNRVPGRVEEQQITIFDSTGLSVQDITTAKRVLTTLKEEQNLLSVSLI